MRNEDELLLLCARTKLGQNHSARIHDILLHEIDSEYLIQSASRNGVHPLLYLTLGQTFRDFVPKELIGRLRNIYLQNVASNILLTKSLLKIINLFNVHNIAAIPYKGPLLSAFIYGDVFFRSFGDLDILIDKNDVHKACALLASQGYQAELDLTRSQLNCYMNHEQDIVLVSKDNKIVIELHWEISRRYSAKPQTLQYYKARLIQTPLFEQQVTSLSAEDLIVFLCQHGTKHGWARLEWSFCIAEFANANSHLDWALILELADELRCRRILLLGLALARDLYDVVLPAKVIELLSKDQRIKILVQQVKWNLFHREMNAIDPLQIRYSRFQLQAREGFFYRFRYLCRLVFRPTKTEWQYFFLPAPLSFLYYLFRPMRLLLTGLNARFLKCNSLSIS